MLQTGRSKDVESSKVIKNEQHAEQGIEETKPSLYIMVLMGMLISGMIESSAFPKSDGTAAASLIVVPATGSGANHTRRYCDPPNMTIMALYDIYYDSEEENFVGDYDFAQMEEMDFQVAFSMKEMESHRQWQAFLWGSLVGPLISSWSAPKFGPGRVFGFSVLVSSVIGMFTATAGTIARTVIIGVQGAIHSKILPCCVLLGLAAVPERKITTFLALLAGSTAGSAIGQLIPDQFLPFVTCIISVTWFSAWVLMFNTPKMPEHKHSLPWKQFLTSHALWMSTIAVIGTELSQCAVGYTLRMYLYLVYNVTAKHLLAAPMVGHLLFSLICGQIGEVIETTEIVSRTVSRKIFVYVSHFLPAGALFLSGFVGCVEAGPAILFAIATVFSGAAYSGAFASMLDIAPNFGAIIVGFVCTCGSLARLTPVILTSLIFDGFMPGSWRTVLSVSALIALLTAMLFMLRGSSRHQPWNDPELQRGRPRRSTARLNMEEKILKVLMVQEREKLPRARACSTSVTTTRHHVGLKRASIS